MFIAALCLGVPALAASALFSGSETGFYRVPRIRLKLDAMSGDRMARRYLWLANNPSFFVATVLVGNNIANNMISMSSVLLIQFLFPESRGIVIELFAAIVLAPFLFVYGEMFPKFIFLQAPYRLLRFVAVPLNIVFWILIPVTSLLWLLNKLIARLLGRTRDFVQLSLARNELALAFDEGREAGVLVAAQRTLIDGVFIAASQKVRDMIVPLTDYPVLRHDATPEEARRLARRHGLAQLPVFREETPIGYVRLIDVELAIRRAANTETAPELPVRDFLEIDDDYTPLAAMSLFQQTRESFGCVINREHDQCVGLLEIVRLNALFLNEGDRQQLSAEKA